MSAAMVGSSNGLKIFKNEQAWYGPAVENSREWVYQLDSTEIAEVDRAISAFKKTGKDVAELLKEDFPLGKLGEKVSSFKSDLFDGRGFILIRGVPVERYSKLDSAIVFLGIGCYLGMPVSQNGKGHILGHVKNLGADFSDPETRGYQTNSQLAFHTDYSDVVGLLCLQTPKSGGESSLASSTTVWNEMFKRDPALAEVMTQAVCYTRWGEIADGEKRYNEVPVFTPMKNRMVSFFNARRTIMKAQAFPEVPRVTDEQLKALDLLESIVHDPAIHMNMTLEKGDIQFLCNHYVFHTRTAYEDWPEMEKRRHLLRLWLACEDGPEIPEFMTNFQGKTSTGRPAGIHVKGVPFRIPMEAE